MEDNLNCFENGRQILLANWYTAYFFSLDKIEDNIIFKPNGRQPIFFDRMENDLNFNINRRQAK